MDRDAMTFDALVVELRKCAGDDADFAQVVALACATIADRASASDDDPGQAIRRFFRLA